MATLEQLPFDTKLFGFKTGTINLGHINVLPNDLNIAMKDAKEQGFRLVYVKYSAPAQLAINLPNVEVYNDTKVTFTLPVNQLTVPSTEDSISDYVANGAIAKELYELAYTSGQHSRFIIDNHFPKHVFTDLYDIWLQKSVSNEIASKVFVYTDNKQILGFVTVDMRDEQHSRIGLIGVSGNSQGKGIGKKLINATILETIRNSRKNILVDTQLRNEQACRFYLKNGFELFSTEYIANCWI